MDEYYYIYRQVLSYRSYLAKKKIGKLPRPYKGYVKYLHGVYGDWMSYDRFAYYYRKLGYEFIKSKVALHRK